MSYIDVLREVTGIPIRLAPSNDIGLRLEAVRGTLGRLIEGKAGFILSPACVELRKALAGRYCYRRVQVGNDERYEDKPSKNRYSHVADALQYALLGSGAGKQVTETRVIKKDGEIIAQISSEVFTRNDGTWISSQEFRIPENWDVGQYTLEQIAKTNKSTISGTAKFFVE